MVAPTSRCTPLLLSGSALKGCLFAPVSHKISLIAYAKIKPCTSSGSASASSRALSQVADHLRWHDTGGVGSAVEALIKSISALVASALVLAQIASAELQSVAEQPRTGQEDLVLEQASISQGSLEDGLNKSFRQLEAKLDSATGFISDSLSKNNGMSSEEHDAAAEEGRELIKEVWEIIARKYVDARGGGFDHGRWDALRDAALAKPLRDKQSAYRSIREMLANGLSDPYTRFITGEQFQAMQSYDITGVGLNICTAAELEEKTDFRAPEPGLYILGLINRSSASRAGLQQGDRIVAVDGVALGQQSPFQAASLIAGQEGALNTTRSVTVQVKQAGSGDLREVSLQRPPIDPSPVQSRLVEYEGRKIGQIRLDKFVARSQQDIAAAVQGLAAEGAQEYVLDLRNNLGGLVEEGVEVARLFLDGDATIVNRLDSGGLRRKTAAGGAALTHAPITLLVNERTASASEILAGALRDNCRAVLVGQRTFGKGLIQGVFQLEDGSALAVTIGKYLTPARVDIDREGIRPDFGSIPEPAVAAARLAACKLPTVA